MIVLAVLALAALVIALHIVTRRDERHAADAHDNAVMRAAIRRIEQQ